MASTAAFRVLARRTAAAASVSLLGASSVPSYAGDAKSLCEERPPSPGKKIVTESDVHSVDLREKIAGALGGGHPPRRNSLSKPVAQTQHIPSSPDEELPPEEARIVQTFERVAPSVAYIQTTALIQQYGYQRHRPFSLQETEIPAGTGSGFLYDSNGHVITNYHVVASGMGDLGGKVKVKCHNMVEAQDATVVGVDPDRDLAVLKIDCKGIDLPPPIEMASDSSNIRVGQTVLAIGNPFGLDTTLTTGVVSALGRDVMGAGGRPIRGCIQMSAAINPGNSGGPLLDSRGRLIGINMAIISPGMGGGNVGIGFAIPATTVKRVVNQIIKHGRVVRPTMGVNIANERIVQSIGAQLGIELQGALVAEVLPGGPADLSGMMATKLYWDGTVDLGDLIVEADGSPISNVEDLLEVVERHKGGDSVTIKVWRGCNPKLEKAVKVKLTTQDQGQGPANHQSGGWPRPHRGGRTSMVSDFS